MSSTQNDPGSSSPTPPITESAAEAEPPLGRGQRRAFGHSADRARVVEVEGAAIRDAARRVLAGETLSSIVADWNRRGLPTVSGGDEWLSQRRTLAEKSVELRAQLERLNRLDAAMRLAGTGATLRASWPGLTIKERRDILGAVLDHVIVLAAEPPRQVFRAERLQPVWIQ